MTETVAEEGKSRQVGKQAKPLLVKREMCLGSAPCTEHLQGESVSHDSNSLDDSFGLVEVDNDNLRVHSIELCICEELKHQRSRFTMRWYDPHRYPAVCAKLPTAFCYACAVFGKPAR